MGYPLKAIIPLCVLTLMTLLANLQAQELLYPGSDRWSTPFDTNRALEHVRVLASDSLRGRYSGFAGADKAERYIADYFWSLGLRDFYGEQGNFHEFTYGAGEYTIPSSLVMHFADGAIDSAFMWEEINIYKYSGFGKVRGKVVFVGYGISAPDKGWDDYAGIDVKGAIVLACRGVPDIPDVIWDEEFASGYKSTTALSKGAVGFMLTEREVPKYATITDEYFREELPAVWISSIVADSLLKETSSTVKQLLDKCKTDKHPQSRVLSAQVELQVSGTYFPERKTRNVIGKLPGTAPQIHNEIIVIGAHMDHHGVDAAGNLYPGADDNASGSATMMELARVFAESPARPLRRIYFVGFAAEEEGLVGSKKFVELVLEHKLKVVAMLNMDMVGQGDGRIGIGGIDEFPILGDIFFKNMPDSVLDSLEFWSLYAGSDHTSFQREGIPSYVIGARGGHPNYHTPYDTAGAIKGFVMKNVADMMYHCANAFANEVEYKFEVNKAQWLIRKSGGIRFTASEPPVKNRYFQTFDPFHNGIKQVKYPKSVEFMEMQTYKAGRGGIMQHTLVNQMYLTESVREYIDEFDRLFMVDSIRSDFKGETFTGLTFIAPAEVLPEDSFAVKSLTRLGVGFVDLTDYVKSKKKLDKDTLAIITDLANRCELSGMRPVVQGVETKVALQVAEIWNKPLLYRVGVEYFNWDLTDKLIQENCFILFVPSRSDDKKIWGKFSDQMEMIVSRNQQKNFGLASYESLVQYLLDAGIDQDIIEDMLQNNLRRMFK